MMNFDTNNLIIACYPGQAGGRFLINSLGLSDDAVFQDQHLAQQQLELSFNQQDKFNLLETRINEVATQHKWRDLGLSCSRFFGINTRDWHLSPELIRDYGPFTESSCQISNSDKKFFIAAHWPDVINRYLSIWPNARVIMFENFTSFINFRLNRSVPAGSAQETYFSKMEESYKEQTAHLTNIIYRWDTNRYFDEDQTVQGIKELYNILNLKNFNEDLLRRYHNLWITKLIEFKNK
jgi:hypothetical protein